MGRRLRVGLPNFLRVANGTMMTGLESIGWAAFSGVAGVSRGLTGIGKNRGLRQTYRKRGDETQDAKLTPFGKHMRVLESDLKQILTGRRQNASTMKSSDAMVDGYERLGNSITGAVKLLSDTVIGTPAMMAGWAGHYGLKAGAYGLALGATGSFKGARMAARGLGAITSDTLEMAWGNAKGASNLMHTNLGAWGTFGAVAVGGTAATGLGLALTEVTPPVMAGAISALPGTTKAVERFVDTGADGDLVFAMHKMR